MKTILIVLFALLSLSLGACTDAEIGKFKAYGDSAHVTCFSGGEVVYDGYSTGKIISEADSDGYFFTDKETRRNVEVSGDCVIRY